GSCGTAAFAVVAENHAVLSAANADGILQQGCKDALEVERRPADGLEHLGRSGLLPQRLAQLLRARLHLVEQPHVLDRDHRLVGEGRNQLDLLVGEWTYGFALYDDRKGAHQLDLFWGKRLRHLFRYEDHPDHIPLAQQRDTERGAIAADLLRSAPGVIWVR